MFTRGFWHINSKQLAKNVWKFKDHCRLVVYDGL